MKKNALIYLFAPGILATIFICTLPSILALTLSFTVSGICGWRAGTQIKKPFPVTMGVLGGAFIILLGLFLFLPHFFNPLPFYPIAAAVALAFWYGNRLSVGQESHSPSFVSLLVLGILALFAVAGFSFLGNEDIGLYGRILVYGAGGAVLSKVDGRRGKQILFLTPIMVLGLFQYIAEPSPFAWFLHIAMPLTAVISLILGHLLMKPGYWPKVVSLTCVAFGVVFIHLTLPDFLQQSTWQDESVGSTLPAFELIGLDEDTLRKEDLAEKIVWLEFYNLRCKSCILEMASVEHVADEFVSNDQVKFVTISSAYYESFEDYRQATNFHEFKLWHGYEFDSTLASRYAPHGVPVGLLVDKQGIVRFQKLGFGKKDAPYFEADLKAKISALLAER